MLFSDPFYRTITGFEVLIEKEWVSFGHKFHRRLGHHDPDFKDEQRAPIFVQFIDCVWQAMNQFPTEFEFTSALLLEVLDNLYSCRFGTFLCDSEAQRMQSGVFEKTASLWTYINSRRDKYRNIMYSKNSDCDVLVVNGSMRFLRLWEEYYLRSDVSQVKNTVDQFMRDLFSRCKKLEERCLMLEEQFNC